MEKDIEILKEVVHVKAKPCQGIDNKEDCSNIGCANKIKTYEEQIHGLLYDQQQSKTELLDVFRAKEKYKRLFKQIKQENEQLKSELFYYKSRERLEPDLGTDQRSETFEEDLGADARLECIHNARDDQKHLAAEQSEFKCFVLTSPKQEINDLPSSFSFEESQTSNEKEDCTLEIDERCFQGIYTPQIAHILEIRFQESSILSKETMEECCRLTNLTKPQVIRWFHMRRPESKRSRRFNAHILSHLRQFYVHNQFPSKAERAVLAHKTNLSNVQVRSWFKKQRERQKKQNMMQKPTVMWHKLLEESLNRNMNTSPEEIRSLQQKTLLSKEQIEKWFENRRQLATQITRKAPTNETVEADYFSLQSVGSATSFQDESFRRKRKLHNESQFSNCTHGSADFLCDSDLSSSSNFNVFPISLRVSESGQDIGDNDEQKVVPVYNKAIFN